MSSKRDKEKPSKISIAKREARNDVKSLTKEMNDLEVKDGDTTSDLLGGDTVQNKELSEGCMRLNMVKQIQDISKVALHFRSYQYHCQLCNSFLKEMKSVFYHTRSEGHVDRLEEKLISQVIGHLPDPTPLQISAMTELVEDIYSNHSSQASDQDAIRRGIVKHLSTLVKPVWGEEVVVEMFGSSQMSVALDTSDVNISINIEDTDISQNEIPAMFLRILEILKRSTKEYSNIQADFYSPMRIPRILFQHLKSKLWCELRIGSYVPCQVASLIQLYCRIDNRVAKLCVAMKYWAKVFRVDAHIKGHYPSIVIVLMVLHYLQQATPPIIPVLHEEVTDSANEDGRGSEKAEFDPELSQLAAAAQEWKGNNTQSVGELLHGLLKYYVEEMVINKHAITIRQLVPLARSTRDGWGSNRLAVEDPVLTKNNISRAAGSDKVFEHLIRSLKLTHLHMLQMYNKLNKLLEGITQGTIDSLPTLEEEVGGVKDKGGAVDDSDEEDTDVMVAEIETGEKVEGVKDGDKDGEGARNLTEEILRESKVGVAIGRKGRRSEKKRQQIMRALEEMSIDDKDVNNKYSFRQKDFKSLFKDFPIACLLCRRARHTALECPDEDVPKLNAAIKWPPSHCEQSLTRVLEKYAEEVMLRPNEETQRKDIRNTILKDIKTVYPKASLELFGSSANQFGHCNSDMDLCLLMNEEYSCEKIEIIGNLAKHLKKIPMYRGVGCIPSARVPIIKLSIDKWNIDCDISMENCLALQNTRMLATYASIDTRVRTLGYTLKCFAKVCDMCDASTGSISSYAYILMLIHFLQQYNIVPVLQKLSITDPPPSGPIIEGWNCYYFSQMKDLHKVWRPDHTNIPPGELWFHFLVYYSREFDWRYNVVTIRQKEPLNKFQKNWTSKPMAIEDPFNLDHNLARAVSNRMRFYILKRFHKAISHHTKPIVWKSIDDVMSPGTLCGDYKPPKFIICDKCNKRGHRAAECTRVRETNHNNVPKAASRQKSKEQKAITEDSESGSKPNDDSVSKDQPPKAHKTGEDTSDGTVLGEAKQGNEKQLSRSYTSTELMSGKSRSQIRRQVTEDTGGSMEELKKWQIQLKMKAHSSKGTPLDKKVLSVCSEMIRSQMKKTPLQSKDYEFERKHSESSPANMTETPPPLMTSIPSDPERGTSLIVPEDSKSHPVHQTKPISKGKREKASIRVIERSKTDNGSSKTVLVQPKKQTSPLLVSPSTAVPFSSFHVTHPAMPRPPEPLQAMPRPLLSNPTHILPLPSMSDPTLPMPHPVYPMTLQTVPRPSYQASPPPLLPSPPSLQGFSPFPVVSEGNQRPLFDQPSPPLIPGSYPPFIGPSLLPRPPPPSQQWYSKGYQQ